MADVSSLELSKELYGLSEWDKHYGLQWAVKEDMAEPELVQVQQGRSWPEGYFTSWPAYTAGYLLRKLPIYLPNADRLAREQSLKVTPNKSGEWFAGYAGKLAAHADTPENALCKLAIMLLNQNIIKRGEE